MTKVNEDAYRGKRKWLVQKARRLAGFCRDNGFAGWECLLGMKVSHLAEIYNGIGPDWDWSVISDILSHIDPIFEPAAFIQDIQYKVAKDRSDENFHRINNEFHENCLKCVELGCRWWQWLRRRRLIKSAWVLFNESEEHGMKSWRQVQ